MSDVAKWRVSGAVKTLRTEFALWDPNRNQWQPARNSTLTSFRPDGAVSTSDAHNPDGSLAHSEWLYDPAGRLIESNSWLNDAAIDKVVYVYDELGRHQRTFQLSQDGTQTDQEISSYDARGVKTKLSFLRFRAENISYGIEGTDQGYGAPGAARMITTYDEKDLPVKVVFQDADGHALREVIFVRDSAGRLLADEMRVEGLPAMVMKALGETFSSTRYVYDSSGRLVERTNKMGSLGQVRTTYRHGDRDDPIEETTENINREASVDDDGTVHYSEESVSVQHSRLEYQYDAQGNWTERIVSSPDGQPSNIERREITYF